MGRYIYVQAMVNKDSEKEGLMLSFRHTEVSADSEDDAYHVGQNWWKHNPVPSYVESVSNDYVIKVG